MRVFAEYFEEDGLKYRRNTILQFGESWELIGNAVLANPGSAEPVSKPDEESLNHIKVFFSEYRNEKIAQDNWFEFSSDPTMGFVEKIFNGFYINENHQLNGVIQLFNTFNIKNENLEEAVAQIGTDSELLFSYNIEKHFQDKPTYFGFSNEVLNNELLRKVAKQIFTASSPKVRTIYKREFSENSFYHPMYVNRAFRQHHFVNYKNQVLAQLLQGYRHNK